MTTITVCGQNNEGLSSIKKLINDNEIDPLNPKPFYIKNDSIYKLCDKLNYDEGKLLCLEDKIYADDYLLKYNKQDYTLAKKIAKKLKNYESYIHLVVYESYKKTDLGLFNEVDRDLQEALALTGKIENGDVAKSRRRVYNGLANLAYIKKSPFATIEYYNLLAYREAMFIKDIKYKTEKLFVETQNLADLYVSDTKKFRFAKRFINESDSIAKILKFEDAYLVDLNNIKGIYYYKLKNYNEAINYFNKSLQFFISNETRFDSYSTLAKIYTIKSDLKKASDYFEKADSIKTKILGSQKKDFQNIYENKESLKNTKSISYNWILFAVLLVLVFGLFFFLFFNRYKIYQSKKSNNELILEQKATNKINKLDSKFTIEEKDSKFEQLYNEIIEHFEIDFPYRDENYTISTLAEKLNTNIVYISKSINIYKGVNFKKFVNEYRINEIKKRLQQNEHKQYTFQSIYKSNGFSNQTTFNRAFKKIEGVSPKQYVEKLNKMKI